ncbi:uncharacterized protein LOC133526105 isoform X9 [Cydia pomonella]|uniref:uncharacterized protein LOC133526105 isoform X9 n=1 Tax=Cydia pomonella TaxID=82600 RepID=UPI002ADD9FE8|nr:uncharacterized protein LOC133526105 isoform X9 [Cydia pomonella]
MGKMKKRTISTLKAIFGSKKGKRHHSSKSSRSVTPDPPTPNTPSSVESFRPIPRTPPPARVGPPPSPPVPTRPIAPVAPEPSGPVRLIPCAVCGRTFVPESLAKHVKICEKTAAKKRKTFDSSRQRREGLPAANGVNTGTDLEQYLPKNFGLPENSPFLEKSPPNTAKAAPKAKPQSVRTTVMKPAADLQKCPHCSRAFGVRAFERHVEWCADKAKILPAAPVQPPHITDAKQRLNARTKYKAPLARGRRSSQSRDKSSQSRSASVESSRGASPPPPRDCGDGRRRARASESMSSNDCNDEPSPHVPVIRNTRNSQNNSSGDANVKARQARLARDLSSSSSNNVVSENLFPSSVKRSTSLLDSIHKKVSKTESGNTRHKSDQLEQDIMQSLKEFDKFYESEKNQMNQSNKDVINYNAYVHNGTEKESRSKTQRKSAKSESHSNGNYTPNGKSSNDSAYSRLVSLNRISPSKLTVCPKESNGPSSLERIPAGSDSSGSPKDEIRSVSSEEFLAMERSAELDEPIPPPEHAPYKEVENQGHEKRVSSRASSRRGSWRPRAELSSSSSEVSLHKAPARLSRFCHECGSRFPVDTAKFCIECGVKRLAV